VNEALRLHGHDRPGLVHTGGGRCTRRSTPERSGPILPMTQHPPGYPGEVRNLSNAQHVVTDLKPSHGARVKAEPRRAGEVAVRGAAYGAGSVVDHAASPSTVVDPVEFEAFHAVPPGDELSVVAVTGRSSRTWCRAGSPILADDSYPADTQAGGGLPMSAASSW
jgi:hypothetical protein